MIGTPDIHEFFGATELVRVVRNVGREVRVLTVGLDQHAVLVIAEVGAPQPRSLTFVKDHVSFTER